MIITTTPAEVHPAIPHNPAVAYLDRLSDLFKIARDAAYEASTEAGRMLPVPKHYAETQAERWGWERGAGDAEAEMEEMDDAARRIAKRHAFADEPQEMPEDFTDRQAGVYIAEFAEWSEVIIDRRYEEMREAAEVEWFGRRHLICGSQD